MTGTVAYILAKKLALNMASGISGVDLQNNELIFKFKDGTSASMTIPIPKDGLSITNLQINSNNHLICTLSDNTVIDAGELPHEEKIIFTESLPVTGVANIIYVYNNGMYVWNKNKQTYIQLANGSGNIITWNNF